MRAPANIGRGFAIALAVSLAGCSLALDPDKKDCTQDSDCRSPYVCGKGSLCEAVKGCEKDSDCRQPGICEDETCVPGQCEKTPDCQDDELCNTATKRCIKAANASCSEPADCASFDEAAVCVRAEGVCGAFECKAKKDCGTSSTVRCLKGACVDETWGCLGLPDARPKPEMSSQGTVQLKVLYVLPKTGEDETPVVDLEARACPFNDTSCATPVSKDWTYKNNLLTVRGLENGKNYRIRITAKHPSTPDLDLLETEYFMYRTVQGDTKEPQTVFMFEGSFRDMIAGIAGVTADPDLGIVLAYTLDCQGKEVEGITVGTDKMTVGCGGDPTCATTVFYFTTANVPDPGATQTSLAGRLGVANLVPDVFNRITLTRVADNKKITSFVITPRKGVVSYTEFFPQDFGTSAD